MFRFTIGEALRKGTLIFYFSIASCLLLFFAFGIRHSPNEPETITIFGLPFFHHDQPNLNVVEFILIQLHSSSVFWIILFGIFGVAGLIPNMLEKGTIDLFLSKPLARAELLMARSLGAVAGIAINLIYFFLGIWFIFGLKIGVWHWGFLSSVLYLVYAFICFFSIVTLVGLMTRSSGLSTLLALLYALLSWGLEVREIGFYKIWNNYIYHRFLDTFYYIIPQLSAMIENSSRVVGKNPFIPDPPVFTYMPYIYSFFSTSLIYLLSIWYFSRQDY